MRQHPAVAALPQSYISSNDVVVAITWLLSCDLHQRPKPGHAPPGGMNFALLVLDLLGNDRDGLLTSSLVPPGDVSDALLVCSSVESGCKDDTWKNVLLN